MTLQTNITNYSIAVMLSASVSAYKGDIPRNHVLVCLLLIVLKMQLNSL